MPRSQSSLHDRRRLQFEAESSLVSVGDARRVLRANELTSGAVLCVIVTDFGRLTSLLQEFEGHGAVKFVFLENNSGGEDPGHTNRENGALD